MELSAGLPLATGFSYGNALVIFFGGVLFIHGLINFGLIYYYKKRGGPFGALAMTFSFVGTLVVYIPLIVGCGFDSPLRFLEFGAEFPYGTIGMLSPLSVFYFPIAIFQRCSRDYQEGSFGPKDEKEGEQ